MLYKVRDLDTQLSLKIGDYVNDNGDGLIFTQLARLNYLEKAYNKTVRLLNISMEKYAPQFAKRHYLISVGITKSKAKIDNGYSKINQIVVHYQSEDKQEYTTFAAKLDEESFLATKYKLNDQRSPDFKDKIIYYSVINDEIHFLPEDNNSNYEYIRASILFLKDGVEIKSVNDEIALEKNYIDLILSFASAEAMVDLGRGDKANAFYDDAYSQIKLLQQLALVKKKEAGNV